jgi:putative ABC transport system ATP-binding protein
LARAFAPRPKLVLADEPTGNLDDVNGRAVMDLLLSLARGAGTTLLFVTHSREFAALADETWELHSGRLELP